MIYHNSKRIDSAKGAIALGAMDEQIGTRDSVPIFHWVQKLGGGLACEELPTNPPLSLPNRKNAVYILLPDLLLHSSQYK